MTDTIERAATSAGGSSRPAAARSRRAVRKVVLGAAGILGFLVVWQLIPATGIVDPRYLPYATDTLAELMRQFRDLQFWRNVGTTLTAWGLGLLIATALGVVFGTVVGLVPFLRRSTHTMVEFLRPIPSVALIPLVILLFGLRPQAGLVIIVFASFWQVFVQVLYGVADVDTVARDTARSFGLSRAARVRWLVLPTALPYLMTGIRLAATVALILAVTTELLITTQGLGGMIILAGTTGNTVTLYAVVVMTGLLGLAINLVFRVIERRALSWHQSVRGEEVL